MTVAIFFNLILWLVIIGVLWWVINRYAPMPAPLPMIINAVFIVLLLLIFLGFVGVVPFHLPRLTVGG